MKTITFLIFYLTSLLAFADPQATHGMVLFGDQTSYVSHLPMFHAPHDYQFVAEVSLADIPRSETLKSYDLHKAQGETFFTIAPEPFDLSLLVSGEKEQFKAQLYLGHFEQGGEYLGLIEVNVTQSILAKKLDPKMVDPNELFSVHYIAFGKKGEYYVVHDINEKPSFDFIAKVEQPYFTIETRLGPEKRLVKDSNLPLAIEKFHFGPIKKKLLTISDFLPIEGELIGNSIHFNGATKVKEIIYQEVGELSH